MLAEFKTYTGYRVLLTVTHNGKAVPFGSIGQLVSEQDGLSSGGIVGDNGDIYFSGMPEQGKIHIKWEIKQMNSVWPITNLMNKKSKCQ